MIRKSFICLLIVAFFNFIMSCSVSSNQKVTSEEITAEKEVIHQLILTNAEKITFDENGGKLFVKNNIIEGKSTLGNKKSFELNQISNISWIDDSILNTGNSAQFLEYVSNKTKRDINSNTARIKISEISINNDTIVFDNISGKYIKNKAFVKGYTNDKQIVEIEKSKILYATVKKINTVESVLATMGLLVVIFAGILLIAIATKQSCPFVYSFDGDKYIFDAEPLGGATTKGLKRTELSKLEYLNPVSDKYKLLVKNEVPETQYIDEMSLLVVDHRKDSKVYTDLDCNINTVTSPKEILSAIDEFGNEITDFVRTEDDIFWQTQLPFDTTKVTNNLRHQLTFTFPKPIDRDNAKLIINAGTSLWGSNMIREIQTLYGSYIDTWYEQIDRNGIEKEQMMQFIEREELYIMKAKVKEGDNWVTRASINGGGPFISETRAYDLDLENVIGDTLFIQFNIPYGFWTLNYLAIDYEYNNAPLIEEIKLVSVIDHNSKSISTILNNEDEKYYIMPKIGNFFFAEANAPDIKKGFDRTIFLKTSGYYKLHLNKEQPMQTQILLEIGSIPGRIVDYSIKCFQDLESNYNK